MPPAAVQRAMEYPKPTIDLEAELQSLLMNGYWDRELTVAEATAGVAVPDPNGGLREHVRSLLSQAWEEGRWSPPGACMNPYGEPAARPHPEPNYPALVAGWPLTRLRSAAQAALAWIENMSPTTGRTTLAKQLRDALGDK